MMALTVVVVRYLCCNFLHCSENPHYSIFDRKYKCMKLCLKDGQAQ